MTTTHPQRFAVLAASVGAPASVRHVRLLQWVREIAALTKPDRIEWCDGSSEEYDRLCDADGRGGNADPARSRRSARTAFSRARILPTSRASRTGPSSAASARRTRVRPTTGSSPARCAGRCAGLFDGCMRGRTMYVVPFSMGPLGSPIAHIGVEITDSPYVVVNMRIMTRMGAAVYDVLGEDGEFVPCVHSVGAPLAPAQKDVAWPCNAKHKYIVHFPETREIWSYGSGYGGNALLGQEVLRAAHRVGDGPRPGLARRAHADPRRDVARRREALRRGGVPQRLRQDQLRDADSAAGIRRLAGDDDRRRHRLDQAAPDGRFRAINPEAGYFGVAPGTSYESNPNAMKTLRANVIFTNVALTDDGDVWWEGMTKVPPAQLIDWQGKTGRPAAAGPAAHPERALHRRGDPVSVARSGVGQPRGRADLGVRLRRAALRHRAAGVAGAQLGRGRLQGGDDGFGDDRCRHRQGRRGAARSVRDAAVLRLSHRRLLRSLAAHGQSRVSEPPRDLQRQLVPQGRRRQASRGRVSARTCGC